MEKEILSTCLTDREAYEQIERISGKDLFSELSIIIYDYIRNFYKNDPQTKQVDVSVIKSKIEREYPKYKENLCDHLTRIEEASPMSIPNVIKEAYNIVTYKKGYELGSALINNPNASQLDSLLEEYKILRENNNNISDSAIVGISLEEIKETIKDEHVIKLYPKRLQDAVKYLTRGHHLLVVARPEVGKTMFTINMVRGFLEQGLRVLYLENEDPIRSIQLRVFSSVTGLSREEINKLSQSDYSKLRHSHNLNNIIFKDIVPGTPAEIRSLVRQWKADVVVIEQIRNLNTGSDGLTTTLERAAIEIRNIAKEFGVLCVSVTQAGDSATNKLVLSMSDIDSSKTGLPGAVDVIVAIGCDEELEVRGKRTISLPKNKPGQVHDIFTVNINKTLSRVLDD